MISRGAKNFLVLSRHGIRNGYQSYIVANWRKLGAKIEFLNCNVSTESGVRASIEKAMEMGPVGGIFHLALVNIFLMTLNST